MPVLGGGYTTMAGSNMTQNTGTVPVDSGVAVVIDGTPIRVVMLAFAGAAGLFALKLSGIRFNVGVSS